MAPRRIPSSNVRKVLLLAVLALVALTAGLVLSTGSPETPATTRNFGDDRLVSWEPLPAMEGEMCQWMPASASASLVAALQQQAGSGAAAMAPARPSDAARAEVAKRQPLFNITDPHFAYAGIAVDPIRNEVVIAEENLSSLLVYNRLENTPPAARMSEPQRIIGGEAAVLGAGFPVLFYGDFLFKFSLVQDCTPAAFPEQAQIPSGI